MLRPGHPTNLTCSARHLYPPTGLALTWYRGHQVLENLADVECRDADEEELCHIVSTLLLSGTEVAEGAEFRCQVTLQVGQETFTRVASLVARAEGECQEGLGGPAYIPCAPRSGSARRQQNSAPLLNVPPGSALLLLAVPRPGGAWGCSDIPCDQGCCV